MINYSDLLNIIQSTSFTVTHLELLEKCHYAVTNELHMVVIYGIVNIL